MNTTATIRKQFIMDAQGREIGVILPIEDYIFVEPLLRQREQHNPNTIEETLEEKLRKIALAATDGLAADSIALCYQVRTLDKTRLEKHIGELADPALKKQIQEAIRFQSDL